MKNYYQPYTRLRKSDYDRLLYIKKKHKLGIKLDRQEIRDFISLSRKARCRKKN